MHLPSIKALDCFVVSVFVYIVAILRDYRRRRGLPYPPGPRPWPIIGNLLDIPERYPWVAYTELSKKYGDVMCFRVFGQVVVVLSSPSAIKDLLERRGEVYSDRPLLKIHEVLGVNWLLPTLRKGQVWSDGRKLLDRSLRPTAPTSFRGTMEEKTRTFLGQLLEAPNEFRRHIELLQGKLIMHLTYGYDLKTYNDELILAPVELNKVLAQSVLPGAVLVNHIPFVKHIHSWIPFLSYESVARRCRELGEEIRNRPMEFVRKSMREGTAVPSLASENLQSVEHLSGSERQSQEKIIQEALGSLFGAGSDTSVSAMVSLFLALTLYPEVQRRAQRELDSVLGRDRLPTFEDRPRLPYIDAMCKEVLRWQMVTPLGFPHAATEDGSYKGFFIPKGATILTNAWGVLHDPELYPDPETFNPERFLPSTAETRTTPAHWNGRASTNDPTTISLAFGAGKRICPGRHFVDATLFILAASVLAVFDVSKPPLKKKQGGDTESRFESDSDSDSESDASVSGLIASPGSFGCSITPRDRLAEDLVANVVMG